MKLLLFAVLLLLGINSHANQLPVDSKFNYTRPKELNKCVSLRGNGDRIFATIHSLASLVEYYGHHDAILGSSSGSITAFLYESVMLNPNMWKCGRRACTEKESRMRIAFTLKSIFGYLLNHKDEPQIKAVFYLQDLISRWKNKGILGMGPFEVPKLAWNIKNLFKLKDEWALLDPQVREILQINKPHKIKENIAKISAMYDGNIAENLWAVKNKDILYRIGLINFEQIAHLSGKVANFYAMRGKNLNKHWQFFLNKCTPTKEGLLWKNIRDKKIGKMQTNRSARSYTCESLFSSMIDLHKKDAKKNPIVNSRELDKTGAHMRVLVTSSVFHGENISKKLEEAKRRYITKEENDFSTNFDNMMVGYWGDPIDLYTISKNKNEYQDLKTKRFLSLGATTWKEAIKRSAGEPGLTNLMSYTESMLSTGGWIDNQGTQALKNLGCEQVHYVTREGGISEFVKGVVTMLGASAEDIDNIFGLENPESSINVALRETDIIWCTHWHAFHPQKELNELIDDSMYKAEVILRDKSLSSDVSSFRSREVYSSNTPGCQMTSH